MDRSRRDFLRHLMWLGGGLAALSMLPRSARAAGTALASLFQATNGALVGPEGLWQPQVIECDWYGCSFTQYQPEAIVELVGTPWTSLFITDTTKTSATAAAVGVRTDNPSMSHGYGHRENFEAHVWGISDRMREGLCVGASCIMCKESEVDAQGMTSDWAAKKAEMGSEASQTKFGCPAGAGASQTVLKQFISDVNNDELYLLYASETDPVDWRVGCADLALAFATAPVTGVACAALGMGQDVGSAVEAALSKMGSAGGLIQSGLNDLQTNQLCVGDWGPIYPRQMTSMGTAPAVGMALAAYRALRIAHTSLGTLKPIVDQTCYLQPFYPIAGAGNVAGPKGFKIGAPALEVDTIMGQYLASQATLNDSRMGFVLWVPTGCWKSYSEIEDCYSS